MSKDRTKAAEALFAEMRQKLGPDFDLSPLRFAQLSTDPELRKKFTEECAARGLALVFTEHGIWTKSNQA